MGWPASPIFRVQANALSRAERRPCTLRCWPVGCAVVVSPDHKTADCLSFATDSSCGSHYGLEPWYCFVSSAFTNRLRRRSRGRNRVDTKRSARLAPCRSSARKRAAGACRRGWRTREAVGGFPATTETLPLTGSNQGAHVSPHGSRIRHSRTRNPQAAQAR